MIVRKEINIGKLGKSENVKINRAKTALYIVTLLLDLFGDFYYVHCYFINNDYIY